MNKSSFRNSFRNSFINGRYFQFSMVVVIIVISFVIAASVKVKARTSSDYTYKYFVTVDVEYGDTLTSIATTYYNDAYENVNDYIMDICKLNHLSSDNIFVGETIIVPVYSNEELPYVGYKISE